MDLCDLYRGTLSVRKLGVLVRWLPAGSALARSIRPGWTVEDLLADLWTLSARTRWELPEDFDHPVRAEITAEAKGEHKRSLKEKYLQRKRRRATRNQS